jgi:hypothetical protein
MRSDLKKTVNPGSQRSRIGMAEITYPEEYVSNEDR